MEEEVRIETALDTAEAAESKKYISNNEFITFLVCTFCYTMMTGFVGGYRQEYMTEGLHLSENLVSIINTIVGIANYVVGFVVAIIIDRSRSKIGKFRPLIFISAIPMAVTMLLSFYVPNFLRGNGFLVTMYLCTMFIGYSVLSGMGNCINMSALVMSPNNSERDNLINWRSIFNAVGNSAPELVILVLSAVLMNERNPVLMRNTQLYFITAVICALIGAGTMLLGAKVIRERTVYSKERQNPFAGFVDIMKNKNARIVLISDFLKSFRGIANYMLSFLAILYFGKTGKKLYFGICTAIGTFVGMFTIKFLLKRFSKKFLYIGSGIYSFCINIAAFLVGYASFSNPDSGLLTVLFFFFMFLTGLQFGASNIIPSLFGAEVLEELEAQTGKRFDASYGWVVGIGAAISSIIATAVAPLLLRGDGSLIGYLPSYFDEVAQATVYPENSLKTKLIMLAVYTVFHGFCMLMAGIPFLFYDITNKRKDEIHQMVLAQREQLKAEGGVDVSEADVSEMLSK